MVMLQLECVVIWNALKNIVIATAIKISPIIRLRPVSLKRFCYLAPIYPRNIAGAHYYKDKIIDVVVYDMSYQAGYSH